MKILLLALILLEIFGSALGADACQAQCSFPSYNFDHEECGAFVGWRSISLGRSQTIIQQTFFYSNAWQDNHGWPQPWTANSGYFCIANRGVKTTFNNSRNICLFQTRNFFRSVIGVENFLFPIFLFYANFSILLVFSYSVENFNIFQYFEHYQGARVCFYFILHCCRPMCALIQLGPIVDWYARTTQTYHCIAQQLTLTNWHLDNALGLRWIQQNPPSGAILCVRRKQRLRPGATRPSTTASIPAEKIITSGPTIATITLRRSCGLIWINLVFTNRIARRRMKWNA